MQDGNEPHIIRSRAADVPIISLNVHFAQSDIVFMLALFYLGFFCSKESAVADPSSQHRLHQTQKLQIVGAVYLKLTEELWRFKTDFYMLTYINLHTYKHFIHSNDPILYPIYEAPTDC